MEEWVASNGGRAIAVDVLGTPAPKGSGRAIMIAGRAQLVPSGSNANRDALRAWDRAIRAAVGPRTVLEFIGRPLAVSIHFFLARPGGHYGKRGLKPSAALHPTGKPDVDKLVRATLDSLTELVFDDDSRIVSIAATKAYCDPSRQGARITVEEWRPAE